MKQINYTARSFETIRSELFGFIKQYFPNVASDFNDSSVGTMLLELNAAVADNLSFNIDRTFQETQRESVQERKNILAMARTLGFNIPGKRSAITIVDFSVDVPPFGDSYDSTYLPVIKAGAQVTGAGKVFETLEDIDFSSPYNSSGNPNVTIIPNFSTNEKLLSYTITKRELVSNGTTKIFKKVITSNDYKPFMEVLLPDADVVSVEQVIVLDGTNYVTNPTSQDFYNFKNRFYEVEALAQNELFLELNNKPSDSKGVRRGSYTVVPKRFIKEYNNNGFCKLTFGGGSSNAENFDALVAELGLNLPYSAQLLNNDALGEMPKANSTMFIKYRVGGGTDSNIGLNVLNTVGKVEMFVNGNRPDYNTNVITSLRVNNPIPALGGSDEPSIEQIRYLMAYNFSSQNRCVTLRDYMTQIYKMPSKFGAPFRTSVHEEQNKVIVSILGLDEEGKLDNSSTSTLKENIGDYLSNYRMINDFVEVQDGRIVNLGFEFNIIVEKGYSVSEVVANAILGVSNYMNINNFSMNENIYFSNIMELVNNIPGIITVTSGRVFNKVGGVYSNNEINQAYIDNTTREIDMEDYIIYGEQDTLFEIKRPETDIVFRIKQV